jgi:hypothetical protein
LQVVVAEVAKSQAQVVVAVREVSELVQVFQ